MLDGTSLLLALVSGLTGYFIGRRRCENQDDNMTSERRVSSLSECEISPPEQERGLKVWQLRERVRQDPPEAVRIRFVHINDVYTLENLPRLKVFIDECQEGLPPQNLNVTIGGDLLSPYPLSLLDNGKGMVDVLLKCRVMFACFGNHEADVGLVALRERVKEWQLGKGTWINTNMPDLLKELNLPSHAILSGASQDGNHLRHIGLIGVCTTDPGLYVAPNDFGGAIQTGEDCNTSACRHAAKLMQGDEVSATPKVDSVVALTHQDTEPDQDLANEGRQNGISVVLGGHDHEEYCKSHGTPACWLLKTGMDANKAAVVDLFWASDNDTEPVVDVHELVPLGTIKKDRTVQKCAESHMGKLDVIERQKAAVILDTFSRSAMMSSKNIRQEQTSMGRYICDALASELQVDCVLFDGGNIRGDRDYVPDPSFHLGGDCWFFTLSDLEKELPWESGMVKVVMSGKLIADAVRYSRTRLPILFGGFLQTDAETKVDPNNHSEVIAIASQPLDLQRNYRVALMQSSLAGMNNNPAFRLWRESTWNTVPEEEAALPAKDLLMTHSARLTWQKLPDFGLMNKSGNGCLSNEEIREAFEEVFKNRSEATISSSLTRLMGLADKQGKGFVSREDYEAIFPLPQWITLTKFRAQPLVSSTSCCSQQTAMGYFLCDGIRQELEVDCVLFDGGNIRGNMDYKPKPGHPRDPTGKTWYFTVRDLARELPWPSEMVTVNMTGEEIRNAVRWSRELKGDRGGFLQVDSGIKVQSGDQADVTHIAGKPVKPDESYTVGLIHNSFNRGMNNNQIFKDKHEDLKAKGCLPRKRESAGLLVSRHFARALWRFGRHSVPSFDELDTKKDGILTVDELLEAVNKNWPGKVRTDKAARTLVKRLVLAADLDRNGTISREEHDTICHKLEHQLGSSVEVAEHEEVVSP
eukprot:TRINITY_DN39015_c0_g1_i1.p1 TRINITY_DN39015_c0_g1~~TRINITY_DN39015_c0_g1_i1.p1  ORF type:complete len:924 (-),score=135.39 TRINITY_DN39015_c0_g1_i1:279-3050(-)